MTIEQQFKEATQEYIEVLEEMAYQLTSSAIRMRKAYAIDSPVKDRDAEKVKYCQDKIDKYKRAGVLKDES